MNKLKQVKYKIGDRVILPSGDRGLVITAYPTSNNNYHLVLKANCVGVLVSGSELMPAQDAKQKQRPS